MVVDCDSACALKSYLGDGTCDRGDRGANFACTALSEDGGDCTATKAESSAISSLMAINSADAWKQLSWSQLGMGAAAFLLLLAICRCRRSTKTKRTETPMGTKARYAKVNRSERPRGQRDVELNPWGNDGGSTIKASTSDSMSYEEYKRSRRG